ncbi:MAG: uridine kinase [Bacteroides sp. SM23_62_1]|nr:MAG: uridine kinase [Bacteroides sp. SM23_62_1]
MIVVGIAGGTGSGKTTLVREIIHKFSGEHIAVLRQDSYYRDNSHLPLEERQQINFDHPSALDFDLLCNHIRTLGQGKPVEQPVYSFLTCTRSAEIIHTKPADILILEGILILSHEGLRRLIDIKVFIDTDPDDMLRRVITRDINERGRSAEQVLERYEKTVKPMHMQFVEPTKQYADIIIQHGEDENAALDILSSIIKKNIRR